MELKIRPVQPTFAAELSNIDLRRSPTNKQITQLHTAMERYGVLVLPKQVVTDDEQIEFSRHLGELELAAGGTLQKDAEKRLRIELADASNLDINNKLFAKTDRNRMYNLGNRMWHSDSSFRPNPAKYSLLSARLLPSRGGNTEFADMRAAYDALELTMKKLVNNLVCEHSLLHSRERIGFDDISQGERNIFGTARQPLVREDLKTGRKSLFLSSHAGAIVGWEKPEALDLLRHLTEHATQREFVYVHKWQLNDLVIWDNRQSMQRVCRFNDTLEARDMRRTTIAGDGPLRLPGSHRALNPAPHITGP